MRNQRPTDTHPEVQRRFDEMIAAKTPEERILLGVSMFQSSKLLVLERLKRMHPNADKITLQKLLLEELYGIIA